LRVRQGDGQADRRSRDSEREHRRADDVPPSRQAIHRVRERTRRAHLAHRLDVAEKITASIRYDGSKTLHRFEGGAFSYFRSRVATIPQVAELKARLSEYLRSVRGGHEITVYDRDQPIARIVPYASGGARSVREPTHA